MILANSLLRVAMSMLFLCTVLLVIPGSVGAASVTPATGSWTTLDAPGSFYTRAFGISGTTIVGDFGDASGYHGFRYDGTTWTTLDAPGSRSTTAYGVDGNNIVGYFNDESGRDHGFLYNGTTWQTLDAPESISTYAYGISGNFIVGHYQDASGTHGFLYDGATWQRLDAPGAVGTYAFGISGNTVVGRYDSGGVSHGFLYDGTTWTTLDAPASTFTTAQDVSGGVVVGHYSDASASNGFIRKGTQWSSLAAPGARFTMAMGISGNNVVGYYNDASNSGHGFLFRLEDDGGSDGGGNNATSTTPGCDWNPAFGTEWDAGKKNLVLITHGWNANITNSWEDMGESICSVVNADVTTVQVFDWSQGANTGPVPKVDSDTAYYNAFEYAVELYNRIIHMEPVPESIHLIAHSAGSNVIQTTVDMLSEHFAHSDKKPWIHLTFLDAYSPRGDGEEYGDLSGSRNAFALYGCDVAIEEGSAVPESCRVLPRGHSDIAYKLPGYAEQYVTLGDAAWTFNQLKKAINFDVSYLNPEAAMRQGEMIWDYWIRLHMWPVYFYNKSIINREYVLPVSADKNEFKLGFPFSIESTQSNKTTPNIDDHKGDWCIVTNVSEPYRRCLDQREAEKRDVVLTDPDEPVTIRVPANSSEYLVDVSQFIGPIGDKWGGVLPEITMVDYSNMFTVEIPEDTTVTSEDSGWNGIFMAPTRSLFYCDVCMLDGSIKMFYSAIKVGLDDSSLSFSRGVRLFFPGEGGRNIGFQSHGESFHEITDICPADDQSVDDLLPIDGECKISVNGGTDLVVWTKHFTTFVTYEEVMDTTAPTTTVALDGGMVGGWYSSNVTVALTATDTPDGTGVATTTYSLDNGTTWLDYSAPFTVTGEGKHTVLYRSTDKAGNVEDTKTADLYIDLTAPEAKISANTALKDLQVVGKDNMGSTTVAKDAQGNYTITDDAGHTTKLVFKRTYSGKILTLARLMSIQYDSAPAVSLPQTTLLYTWSPLPTALPVLMYQNIVVSKLVNLHATYMKQANKTSILILTIGQPAQNKRVEYPGLKVVTVTTTKGVVRYEL